MSWSVNCVVKQRTDLALEMDAGLSPRTHIASKHEASRPTAYKYMNRLRECGLEGMADRSRRPHHSPSKTPDEIEKAVCDVRRQYPTWGPEKIRRYLTDAGMENVPSVRTIARILKRNGFIGPQKQTEEPITRFEREQPNDLWQLDFKCRLHLPGKPPVRVFPMTIIDDCSRFNVCLCANPNSRFPIVWSVLWGTFGEYGLPGAILTDNDTIFRGHRGGITQFTGHLLRLNIRHISGRPYHPQTQGKVERLHGTIQSDVLDGHEYRTAAEVQDAFDDFRNVYNHRRPHQALDLDVPAQHYRPSDRRRPEGLPEVEYAPGATLRKVWQNGSIKVRGGRIHIGEGIAGEYVELLDRGDVVEIEYAGHLVRKVAWDDIGKGTWA